MVILAENDSFLVTFVVFIILITGRFAVFPKTGILQLIRFLLHAAISRTKPLNDLKYLNGIV